MSTAAQSSGIAELIRGEKVHFNLTPAELVEYAIRRGEGKLADTGALVCHTGARTGRSPKDRFIVNDAEAAHVDWNDINQPCTEELFDAIYQKAIRYLQGRELFVQELFAGADTTYRLKVRFVNEQAWHNMFVWNQFVRPSAGELERLRAGLHRRSPLPACCWTRRPMAPARRPSSASASPAASFWWWAPATRAR